jgi:glycosyltransferase involved in cell wall biosynthesis
MRVGFDVTVSARARTGVAVYARELWPALVDQGLDVRRWQQGIGVPGRPWGRTVNGVRLMAWQAMGLGRRAAREGVDLIHATAAIGPLGARRPLVMTIHDATTVTMPVQTNAADRLFQRVFAVEAARRADAIVAPTHVAAETIAEYYGVAAARIRVVPLGVSSAFRNVTPAQVAAGRARYGLDRPYVLYVGADTPRKNLSTLVRAMARLGSSPSELDLVVAGPRGPRDARLDAVGRQAGLPRPVRRLGEVPDAWLPAVYAGAQCVAYVSLCEGFGLPIIEAMAAGAPVVTSACSSMPEVAGGAAVLVNPSSVEELAGAIDRVVHDSALSTRLRDLGLRRSATFDWATTARLTAGVYGEVTGRRTFVLTLASS